MKLFLQSIFILCFVFVSGQKTEKTSKTQKFHFDYLVHYTSETNGKIRNLIGYVYSENPNYFVKISGVLDSENLLATLYLPGKNSVKTYSFKGKQTKKKGDDVISFEYLGPGFTHKNSKKSFTLSKIDDNTLKIDIYKNKKQTNLCESHTMKIKPYSVPLFSAYKIIFFNPFVPNELAFEMEFPENVFVEESLIGCGNGKATTIKLQEIKKVDFNIEIP